MKNLHRKKSQIKPNLKTVTHANPENALKPDLGRQAGPGAPSFPKAGKCFAGVRPRREAP